MKKREIEKFIANDVRNSTPDVLNRIDFESIEMEEKARRFGFKKWFKPVMVPALALSALALLLFAVINVGDGITPGNGSGTTPIAYTEKEEAYTLSALSAVSLLAQLDPNNNNVHQNVWHLSQLSFNDSGAPILLDNHLDQLNRNLNMIEPIIGNKNNMQFALSESELPEYALRMIFTTTDMRGRTVEYTLHYNETQEDDDTYLINGIMMVGATTYRLEGELTLDEDEFELELLAEHPSEEDTYVEITQEVSADEHSLEYKVVRRGNTVFESELTIEFDGEVVTVEIEFESETLQISFEIERTIRNGQFVYSIEYDIEDGDVDEDGEIIVHIVYDEDDDVFYYRYQVETDDDTVLRFRKRISIGD